MSFADRLRAALAQMQRPPRRWGSVTAPSASAPTQEEKRVDADALARAARDLFSAFLSSPTTGRGEALVGFLSEVLSKYGAEVYAAVVDALRRAYMNTEYAGILELLIRGRVAEAVEQARSMAREAKARALARRLGIPVEIVMESMDEKGDIRSELIASVVKTRARQALGLAEAGEIDLRKLRSIISDLRARLKLGLQVSGREFLRRIEETLSRERPVAGDQRALVRLVHAAATSGEREALKTLLEVVGKKPVAEEAGLSAQRLREISARRAVEEQEEDERRRKEAEVRAEHLRRVMSAAAATR